jgi:hypothetical protein
VTGRRRARDKGRADGGDHQPGRENGDQVGQQVDQRRMVTDPREGTPDSRPTGHRLAAA